MEAATALELLRASTHEIVNGEKEVSVAYSGGLDSSIVAAISKEFAKVRCYSCAVSDSYDAKAVKERADSESLDLTLIELNAGDVPRIVSYCISVLGTTDPMRLAYSAPIVTVIRKSREKLVLAGNGADELFGGYAKYASARDPARLMEDDIVKMLREGEELKKSAETMNKQVGLPFTSKDLLDFAKSLPIEKKITPHTRKVILREVAGLLNLPSRNLPKKAAQYSSGVLREMVRFAKADQISLAEWTRRQANNKEESA